MSSNCPSNWYISLTFDSGEPAEWTRKCGGYIARRVKSLDGLQTEALHTPEHGPAVSLGVYSSRDAAFGRCLDHKHAVAMRKVV